MSQDVNGVDDVYEYEKGQVHLISTGTSTGGSSFYDAGESGRDVFFVTAQGLVASDKDGNDTLYDAREGGGFPPGPGEEAVAPECEAEACRPPASEAPAEILRGLVCLLRARRHRVAAERTETADGRRHEKAEEDADAGANVGARAESVCEEAEAAPRNVQGGREAAIWHEPKNHYRPGRPSKDPARRERGRAMKGALLSGSRVAKHAPRAVACVLSAGVVLLLLLLPAAASAAEVQSESVIARATSATLYAQVDPEGHETTCQVQYVEKVRFEQAGWHAAEGIACQPEDLGSGTAAVGTSVTLADLVPGASYRYRLLLTSQSKTVPGPEQSFSTFAVERFSFEALSPPTAFTAQNEPLGQEPFTQASSHPYELSTYIASSTTTYKETGSPDAIIKNVLTQLPPGLIGNPAALPRCPGRLAEEQRCPTGTEVGSIAIYSPSSEFGPAPLFDVIPPEGVAARFAGEINLSTDAYIDAHIRSGRDYGVNAGSSNITALANPVAFKIVLWGVPNSPAHNLERGCLQPTGGYEYPKGGCSPEGSERPFLSLGSDCHGSQVAGASLDSYAEPGQYVSKSTTMPALTGCAAVPFAPAIVSQPTTTAADSATGLHVDLKIPQNEEPEGLATADLKDATVTFPAGLTVNPSSADGLAACSEQQAGFEGFAELNPAGEHGVQTAQFSPGPAECPGAAKLAKVAIETPLLEHQIPGQLYLATPHENPFGSLIAVYLTAYDPISGVVIKLPGLVQTNPETGQVTTTFEQTPQLPFEALKVELPAGERAALTTPETCGSYATTTSLVPWSAPEGNTATPSSEPFTIGEAPGGAACARSEGEAPNSPGFQAGTASPVAGAYSPFLLKLTREDGSQRFHALNVTLPPGLIGKVAGIEECPQADIEAAQRRDHEGEGATEQAHPSCPAGSEVGVVHVGAGSGKPYYVSGHVYFAGPYEGAPFSLAIVTPALAGPFDLGTVVVRAALFIDPNTAQVSVKSDPFPSILDGIPLDIRSVGVEMDRREFTLNPTSCNVTAVGGEEASTAGHLASLSDRFQVGGCNTMPFHPSFSASTAAQSSRKGGAALTVKVAQQSGEANIGKVDVQLPRSLVARDETLNHACTEAQFAKDPAGCPAESVVGDATAHTPILPVPLTGPAIFVSHGGAKFPSLVVALQGDGVTIDLTGQTAIEEGITYSRFETVPDAPISSFELTLPEGAHSALSSNLPASTKDSFCGQSLVMPTSVQGQNGVVFKQQTQIAVNGCEPTLAILSHNTHDRTIALRVKLPAAGRLTATGKGLVKTTKSVSKAATVTLSLKPTPHERQALAKHPHKAASITIALGFTPEHGKALTTHIRLTIQ